MADDVLQMILVLQIRQLVTVILVADREVSTLLSSLERVYAEDIMGCESAVQTTTEEKGERIGACPIN